MTTGPPYGMIPFGPDRFRLFPVLRSLHANPFYQERIYYMKKLSKKTPILAVLLVLAAFFSVFVVSKFAVSPQVHANTIAALEEKQSTVLELTAASTAASAAITLLPGDAATPIAEKLADLSSGFLVVLCAIYLEKYLLTITLRRL